MKEWTVSTMERKTVEEHTHWTKAGIKLVQISGYRSGKWIVQTQDTIEPVFQREPCPFGSADADSVDMYNNGYETELVSLDDGWFDDWEFPATFSEDERAGILKGWESGSFSFMENEGWVNSETQCWVWGELEITD
jgi:hypothetical protein